MSKKLLLLAVSCQLLAISYLNAQTYTISTFAGADTTKYQPEGVPATAVGLGYTDAVAVDASGNVYIPTGQHLLKIGPDGLVKYVTFMGTGRNFHDKDGNPTPSSIITGIRGVTVDKAGNIYLAQESNTNGYITKIGTDGNMVNYAGNAMSWHPGDDKKENVAATSVPISFPGFMEGLAVDASGNLYFTDGRGNCVRKVSTDGILTTYAGGNGNKSTGDDGPATAAGICQPTGLAFDAQGNLYIAEHLGGTIRMVNTAGIISTVAGGGKNGPRYAPGAPRKAIYGDLRDPIGIAVDAAGNVYIADHGHDRINKISTTGMITTIAGKDGKGPMTDGITGTDDILCSPIGIAVDANGVVYFADYCHKRIRMLTPSKAKAAGGGGLKKKAK